MAAKSMLKTIPITDSNFYPRRRMVIVIENDTVGDGIWNPHIVRTLRDYANLLKKTGGSGDWPKCFQSKNGNKITIYSGTYCEEPVLGESLDLQG